MAIDIEPVNFTFRITRYCNSIYYDVVSSNVDHVQYIGFADYCRFLGISGPRVAPVPFADGGPASSVYTIFGAPYFNTFRQENTTVI